MADNWQPTLGGMSSEPAGIHTGLLKAGYSRRENQAPSSDVRLKIFREKD